jgi:hypothetical protein
MSHSPISIQIQETHTSNVDFIRGVAKSNKIYRKIRVNLKNIG